MILQINQLGPVWPYGKAPPLDKCEQLDLKHAKPKLQSFICPQNSPRERVASSGLWTSNLLFRGEKRQQGMRFCGHATKIKVKVCFLSGHHAKVVDTFVGPRSEF